MFKYYFDDLRASKLRVDVSFSISVIYLPISYIRITNINRHALLNTRKLPAYSTCRLCQQTQTLNLLVVVQG
jgi:hypothetical protein